MPAPGQILRAVPALVAALALGVGTLAPAAASPAVGAADRPTPVEDDLASDGAHAFYLGGELTKAETAWRLGKRYVQDQPLAWGCAVEQAPQDTDSWCAPGTTMPTSRTVPTGRERGDVTQALKDE